jgi:xanthosine utilization system XapX-like protein
MTIKQLLINLGKLILCGLAFTMGTVIGGMVASLLKLPVPTPPSGADVTMIGLYSRLTTPLVALALGVIARGLGGSFLVRTLILSFFTWIAYTVNTQLEASIFSTYATGFWFAVVSYLVPALLCGAAVAFLFPPEKKGEDFIAASRTFFARRSPIAWVWRLTVAAVAFMPIYFVFGLLVVPFTGEYYRQSMFGLTMPTLDQILSILFVRSVLFLLACLPILIMWQKSALGLFWRLGFALYVLVGFIYMLISTWLPLYVRFPHALEILADEFAYAGVLVLLIAKGNAPNKQPRSAVGSNALV